MDIGVPVGANNMTPIVPKPLEDYCAAHTTSPDPLLDELAAYTCAHCKDPQMLTGPVEGTLLRMLVQLSGARRVLEIGTYTGYAVQGRTSAAGAGMRRSGLGAQHGRGATGCRRAHHLRHQSGNNQDRTIVLGAQPAWWQDQTGPRTGATDH